MCKLVVLDFDSEPEKLTKEQIKGMQEELNYIYFGVLPKNSTKEDGLRVDKELFEVIKKRLEDV